MARVLVIPDLHIPFEHKRALDFCCRVRDKFKCDTYVQEGDLFDQYSMSRYPKDPDAMNAKDEFNLSKTRVSRWIKEFPKMVITTGNHCVRILKRIRDAGIPPSMLVKTFNTLWGLPDSWKFINRYVVDGVTYIHGAKSGEYAHANTARDERSNIVIAHTHSTGGVHWTANYKSAMFGMNVGCLIDETTYAFFYANEMTRRPVLGCGVIIDGFPTFIPMGVSK